MRCVCVHLFSHCAVCVHVNCELWRGRAQTIVSELCLLIELELNVLAAALAAAPTPAQTEGADAEQTGQ